MPTLRQRKTDGGYYILGNVFGQGIATWQVTEDGVGFLRKRKVKVGESFPGNFLHELHQRGLIYTGKGGLGDTQSIPAVSLPKYEGPLLGLLVEDDRWSPSILFPEIPVDWSPDPTILARCSLAVNGSQELPALGLWPGKGGAAVSVHPQHFAYKTVPRGPWPSQWNLKPWLTEVPGLEIEGTMFGLSNGESIRVEKGQSISPGSKYHIVASPQLARKAAKIIPRFPATIKAIMLKAQGQWEAWEINIPQIVDEEVRTWANTLGHQITLPPWRLSLLTPPPYSYSIHRIPRLEKGKQAVITVVPPASDGNAEPLELRFEYRRDLGNAPSEIGIVTCKKIESYYLALELGDPGFYSIHAATGQAIPISFTVDPGPIDHSITSLPTPLMVKFTGVPQDHSRSSFIDDIGPHSVQIENSQLNLFAIQVSCPVPVDLTWSTDDSSNHREHLIPEQVWEAIKRDILVAVTQNKAIALQIDASNFGRFDLRIEKKPIPKNKQPLPHIVGDVTRWLSAILPALQSKGDETLVALPETLRLALSNLAPEYRFLASANSVPARVLPYFYFLAHRLSR